MITCKETDACERSRNGSIRWLAACTGSRSLLFPVVSPQHFYFSFVSFSTQLNSQQQQLANENECGKIFFSFFFVQGICFLNVFLKLRGAQPSESFSGINSRGVCFVSPIFFFFSFSVACLLNRIINVNLFPIIIIKKA